MAGKTLDIDQMLEPQNLAVSIARKYKQWDMGRTDRKAEWKEVNQYVFATDTSHTTNEDNAWRNTTVVPKLCQIRDNLHANYMASLFPKRKWFEWQGGDAESNTKEKTDKIESAVLHMVESSDFYNAVSALALDYIDYGDCIASVEWIDERAMPEGDSSAIVLQEGYIGPSPTRISPLDIVFNPIAKSFKESPKIIRVLIELGELADMIEKLSQGDDSNKYHELFNDLMENRSHLGSFAGELQSKDDIYDVAGFDNYQSYLQSDYVELLVFYGDLFDKEENKLYKNHIITVVDRYKVLSKEPNPSLFGYPQIFKAGWRKRQDNLWSMGPLDNLLGLQYRLNHVENAKADLFDLTIVPPLKIKGYVDDFKWGPMQRIYVGDDGDVELLSPDVQALNANIEVQALEAKMEEMAGSPKEAMGFRTPGEKTKYEVQRLENAASRIFQSKVAQFEREVIEPLLNAMLEMAKRKSGAMTVRKIDPEFKSVTFDEVEVSDIVGAGRLVPVASRHFAEQAEVVQNLNALFNSPLGQDPSVLQHFSGERTARMIEELLELEPYNIVEPYVRLSEQADAARLMQALEEDVEAEQGVPTGLTADDTDPALDVPPEAPEGV